MKVLLQSSFGNGNTENIAKLSVQAPGSDGAKVQNNLCRTHVYQKAFILSQPQQLHRVAGEWWVGASNCRDRDRTTESTKTFFRVPTTH